MILMISWDILRCNELRQAPSAENCPVARELESFARRHCFYDHSEIPPEERGIPIPPSIDAIRGIADEAHRATRFIMALPGTCDALQCFVHRLYRTPIELRQEHPAVFGDYIDIYDIEQSVHDGATAHFYGAVWPNWNYDERPQIDPNQEATKGEEVSKKEKLKSKWARWKLLSAVRSASGRSPRILWITSRRGQRLEGKGMIVCMSRIAFDSQ